MDPRLQILSSNLRNFERVISCIWRSCPLIPCLANSYFFLSLHLNVMTSEAFHDHPLQSSTYHNLLITFRAHSKTMVIFLYLPIHFLSSPFENTLHEGRICICLAQHCISGDSTVPFIGETSNIICCLADWLFGQLAGRLSCMICHDLFNNQNQSHCLLMADNCNPSHRIKK